MSDSFQKLDRFSKKEFLLVRGWDTIKQKLKDSRKITEKFFISVFLFGGILGVMWTLANLKPTGDLALYLLPFLLLAYPVAMLSPQNRPWEKTVNVLFLLVLWGMLFWCAAWYFLHPNYLFRWLFLAAALVMWLSWTSWKRSSHEWHGIDEGLMVSIWMGGVVIASILLGFLAFYMAGQKRPDPATSNILMGGTFLFFLTLLILRVFWMDSNRYYRANRISSIQSSDLTLLLDWFIPRSYSFLVIVLLLLISEGMMFSTIYQTMQQGFVAKKVKKPHQRQVGVGQSKSIKTLPKSKVGGAAPPIKIRSFRAMRQRYRNRTRPVLMDWILFAFKPYVFPKIHGREVDAPNWFRYLGRFIWGLIIAILLTQQLNIWRQFQHLYLTLLNCVRIQQRGNAPDSVERQRQEALEHMRSLLNNHNIFWRNRIFTAVSVPHSWFRWRVYLDPGRSFFDGVAKFRQFLTNNWDYTLLASGVLLLTISSIFAYIYQMGTAPWLQCFLPSLGSGLVLFTLRKALNLHPPKVYQFWIWWLMLVHVVVSIVLFFLTLNVGVSPKPGFWQHFLWYTGLGTIFVFPILYISGGERYKKHATSQQSDQETAENSDHIVRKMILQTFFHLEHRQWLITNLTYRIHPVRSNVIKPRLVLPSIFYVIIEGFLSWADRIEKDIKTRLEQPVRSFTSYLSLQTVVIIIVFLWHMISYHRLFPREILNNYLTTFLCLISPGVLTLSIWKLRRANKSEKVIISPKVFTTFRVMMPLFTLASGSFWVYWMSFDSITDMLRFGAFGMLLAYPWLGHISFLRVRSNLQNFGITNGEVGWLRRVMRPIKQKADEQKRAEKEYLEDIYQHTKGWDRTQREMRLEMIHGCAEILEEAYRVLLSRHWYEEEEHALNRVYREWLMGDQPHFSESMNVEEEIAFMQEQILDTLSAMLYDLNKEDRREFLQVHSATTEELLLGSLERILSLPRPFLHREARKHSDTWNLRESMVSLFYLLEALLTEKNDAQIQHWPKNEAYYKRRHLAYKVLALLDLDESNAFLFHELMSQSEDEALLQAIDSFGRSSKLQSLLEGLYHSNMPPALKNAAGRGLLCIVLPTPIAIPYRQYLETKAQYVASLSSPAASREQNKPKLSALGDYKQPFSLLRAKEEKNHQEKHKELRWAYYQQIRQLHNALFGYLLASFKEFTRDREDAEKWQALQWDSAEALAQSAKVLELFLHQHSNETALSIEAHIDEAEQAEPLSFQQEAMLYAPSNANFAENRLGAGGSSGQEPLPAILNMPLHTDDAEANAYPPANGASSSNGMSQTNGTSSASGTSIATPTNGTAFGSSDSLELANFTASQENLYAADLPEHYERLHSSSCNAAERNILSLFFQLYDPENIQQLEHPPTTDSHIQQLQSWIDAMFAQLLEQREKCPSLQWTIQLPKSTQSSKKLTRPGTSSPQRTSRTFQLQGVQPLGVPQSLRLDPHCISLERSVFSDMIPKPTLDFYNSEWCLKLLKDLSNSEELLAELSIAEDGGKSAAKRKKKLQKVQALTNRLLPFLGPYTPEEQRHVARRFDMINERLKRLHESPQGMVGKGIIDFEDTYKKLTIFLDSIEQTNFTRIESLLHIGQLPCSMFSFLLRAKKVEEGEIRWYQDINGKQRVLLANKPQDHPTPRLIPIEVHDV